MRMPQLNARNAIAITPHAQYPYSTRKAGVKQLPDRPMAVPDVQAAPVHPAVIDEQKDLV